MRSELQMPPRCPLEPWVFATLQDIMVTATVKTEEPIMGYQFNKTNKNETQVLDQVA